MRLPVVLSNVSRHQYQLFHRRIEAWNLERSVQPRPQVAIREQVEPEQGRQIREASGPGGLELQKLEQVEKLGSECNFY